MKFKFTQIFVVFSNIGMVSQAISELSLRFDELTEVSKIILIIHIFQCCISLILGAGSFYSKKWLEQINYGLYIEMLMTLTRMCNFGNT